MLMQQKDLTWTADAFEKGLLKYTHFDSQHASRTYNSESRREFIVTEKQKQIADRDSDHARVNLEEITQDIVL